MHGVADWLEKLGLSEYAQRFADNAIDLSVLPDLTDQDLEKIGVLLGHRRKILKAIAALNSGPAAQTDAAKAIKPSAPAPPIDAARATGERRYLTVMFCDLVGSTEISAQLDAEEWRDLVGAYLDAASAAVAEMGGHVAKKLGDGLMCLFGYPLAHENDAERAARAAVSIQRALAELNRKNAGTAKPELVARIGLESARPFSMRAARFMATSPTLLRACRRWLSRARSWSPRRCSVRSPGCLSLRNAVAMNLRACRSQ